MSQTLLALDGLRALEEKYNRLLGPSVLMDRAGKAAADYIAGLIEAPVQVTVLCGPGNNGGDGYVCAKALKEKGYSVICVAVGGVEPKTAEARAARDAWVAEGGMIFEDPYATPKAAVVVDAIFGVGMDKPLKDDYLDAAMWFNERQAIHVSIDIPSGLNCETGTWVGNRAGCRAQHTVTFLAGKPGLLTGDGPDACGHIHVDNLGISIPLSTVSMIEPVDFRHILEPRKLNTSKHDFGRVGVIGGARGTVGAALMAARAALRLGAGAVFVELIDSDMTVDPVRPELMFRDEIDLNTMDAIVIGPGLGFSEKAKQRLMQAIDSDKPLVVDADALTWAAKDDEVYSALSTRPYRTVVTPHEGEASRLLRVTEKEMAADRINRSLDLSLVMGSLAVVKGCGTIVVQKSSRCWVSPVGTAALSTPGSGDVLSGMIAAFMAQRFDHVAATIAAVYLHGAASEGCDIGMTADEIAPRAVELVRKWRAEAKAEGVNASMHQSAHEGRVTHNVYSL